MGALTSREAAAAAVAESARRGYLDGQALAGVFAWLRPNDLVWNYVVNNYLLGRKPPAFDVLYWNQDAVRLAAGLHRDFVRLALDNSMTRAGGLDARLADRPAAGRRRQLHRRRRRRTTSCRGRTRMRAPSCWAARSASCCRRAVTSRRSSTRRRDSRSSYRVAGEHPADPREFLEQAPTVPGSW